VRNIGYKFIRPHHNMTSQEQTTQEHTLDTLISDLTRTARLAGQMMTNAAIALHHVDP
jgi:hypothetical protein